MTDHPPHRPFAPAESWYTCRDTTRSEMITVFRSYIADTEAYLKHLAANPRTLPEWLKYVREVAGAVSLPDKGCDEENCKAQIAIGEVFNAVALAATGHEVGGPGPEYDDVGTERIVVYVNEMDNGSWRAHLVWEVSTLEVIGRTGIIPGTSHTDAGVASGEVLMAWKAERDKLFPNTSFIHLSSDTITTRRT